MRRTSLILAAVAATLAVSAGAFAKSTPSTGAVSSANFNPPELIGGQSSSFHVVLSAPAPTGGATVALRTSALSVQLPTSVVVPAGAVFADVPATTSPVSAATSVTATATFGGASASATIRLFPATTTLTTPTLLSPKAGASMKMNVSATFDWSDVPGAYRYYIQLDNTSAFNTILTASSSSFTSQWFYGTPTYWDRDTASSYGTRYWRVRAYDFAGTAGPWSETRSFTVVK